MITIIRSLDESQLDLVISLIAFVSAFLAVGYIIKLVRSLRKVGVCAEEDDIVINSVLSQFLSKVDNIFGSVQNLKSRLDLVEAKISTSVSDPVVLRSTAKSQESSLKKRDRGTHILDVSNMMTSGRSDKVGESDITSVTRIDYETQSAYSDTVTHVLSLLIDFPKTARQIQYDIGRSREHTSRLVRRLAVQGLVRRDETVKPFSYSITDEGRKLLG